jgi:ribosomal protein L11 methyltransferase
LARKLSKIATKTTRKQREIIMDTRKKYLSLRYAIPEELSDKAAAVLAEYPAFTGVYEELDATVVWIQVKEESDIDLISLEINQLLNNHNLFFQLIQLKIIEEENWNKQWEEQIEPIWLHSDVVITPSWKADTVDAATKIIINPQMSFGTGHHETTRLISLLLRKLVKPDSRWVDAGTGTGVLAIVALRYGASFVDAFDFDEWSVHNAEENFALNAIPQSAYTLSQADVNSYTFPACDGIAANLHKSLLLNNFSRFHEALYKQNGTLLLSGLLRYDEQEVIAAAQLHHFTHTETMRENDWIAIHFHV